MRKKILSFVLVVAMVMSIFTGMTMTAGASNNEPIPVNEELYLTDSTASYFYIEDYDYDDFFENPDAHWRYAYMSATEGDAYLATLESGPRGAVTAPDNSVKITGTTIPYERNTGNHDRLVLLKVLNAYDEANPTYVVQSYAYFTLGDMVNSIKVAVNEAVIPEMVPGQALVQGNDYAAFGTFMGSVISFVDGEKLDPMRSGVMDLVAKAPGGEWVRVNPKDPIQAGYTYGVLVFATAFINFDTNYRAYFAGRGAGVTVTCTNGDYNIITDTSLGGINDTAAEYAFIVELLTTPGQPGGESTKIADLKQEEGFISVNGDKVTVNLDSSKKYIVIRDDYDYTPEDIDYVAAKVATIPGSDVVDLTDESVDDSDVQGYLNRQAIRNADGITSTAFTIDPSELDVGCFVEIFEIDEENYFNYNGDDVYGVIGYAWIYVEKGEGEEPEEEETYTTIQNLKELQSWSITRSGNTVSITPAAGASYIVEVWNAKTHGDVPGYGATGDYLIVKPTNAMVGRDIVTDSGDLYPYVDGGTNNPKNAHLSNKTPVTGPTTVTVSEKCIIEVIQVDPNVMVEDYAGDRDCYAVIGAYAEEMGVEIQSANLTANTSLLPMINAGDVVGNISNKIFIEEGAIVSDNPDFYPSGMLVLKVTPDNVDDLLHPFLIQETLAYLGVSSLEGQDLIDAIGNLFGEPIEWADPEIINPEYVVDKSDVYGLMVYGGGDFGQHASLNPNIAITFNGTSIPAGDIVLMKGNDVDTYESLRFYVSLGQVGAPGEGGEETSGIYPYGQNMTTEGLTLHIDVDGTTYQWQVADAADSDAWSSLDGAANTNSVTFTPAETDLWYRCVVDGVPSEAVQAIQVGETVYEFTNAGSNQWYLSNGSMAYFTDTCYDSWAEKDITIFDVVGKYIVPGYGTCWANTSFDGYSTAWQTGAATNPTESYSDYSNTNIEKIKMTFDAANDRAVRVEVKLKAGNNAAAFGTDTMLGNGYTSGDYSDSCSLKAIFEGETLKQIQMVAAESLEKADPDNDLAMVITPITPNAIFWIGAYGQYDANENYGKGEAYGYNKGALYNLEFLSEEDMGEYWEEVFGEPWEDGLTLNDYFNKTYRKEGPSAYADCVTEVQGADSALALSWKGLPDGGTVQFIFSVGTIAETGASVSGLSAPDGSIEVNAAEGATISIKKDDTLLTEDVHYTVEADGTKLTITFNSSAAITCGSELLLGVTVSGSTTWQTIANDIAHSYSWVQGSAQHHQKCSKCGDTTTPTDHYYVDGRCSCGKSDTPALPIIPVTPPTVDVPVSNDETTVDVSASVSGKDATIKPLDDKQIEQLVGNSDTAGDIVIDLTELGKEIDTAGIPKQSLEAIVNAAENAENNTEHLVIKLSTAQLTLDDAAMRAIVDQADGDVIKFNFDDVGLGRMNAEQKEAVKDMDIRKGYEAYITVNGERVSDFKGGTVEIVVPYAIPAGENIAGFSVWYIGEDGKPEKQKSTYDGKEKCFVVTHFSDYVIAYSEEDAIAGSYHVCPKDETCPIHDYTDAFANEWYHDGVHYCIENGLMTGYGDGIFKPDGTTTRAQIVNILWRLEGKPVVDYAMSYTDVAEGKWYTEAVRWAVYEGIMIGYSDTQFAPNGAITREQMVSVLWRYCKHKGIDVSIGEETNILSYDDAFDISEWAIPAMQWACGAGLVEGMASADGTGMILAPESMATRAQIATLMMRFYEKILEA